MTFGKLIVGWLLLKHNFLRKSGGNWRIRMDRDKKLESDRDQIPRAERHCTVICTEDP